MSSGRHDVDLEVEQAFGVTPVNGYGGVWTLLAQSQSSFVGIGIDDEPMIEVLGDRFEVVSHASTNGYGQFKWWRDGRRQIVFEPLLALHTLSGRNPPEFADPGRGTIVELVRRTGGIQVESTDDMSGGHVEGPFALAEALTGVHLTRQVLDTAEFTLAVVAIRPGARWGRPQTS